MKLKISLVLASIFAVFSFGGSANAGWICLSCPPTPDPAPIHQGGWCQVGHCG